MSKWQQIYDDKLVSAPAAAAAIESGDQLWFPGGGEWWLGRSESQLFQ